MQVQCTTCLHASQGESYTTGPRGRFTPCGGTAAQTHTNGSRFPSVALTGCRPTTSAPTSLCSCSPCVGSGGALCAVRWSGKARPASLRSAPRSFASRPRPQSGPVLRCLPCGQATCGGTAAQTHTNGFRFSPVALTGCGQFCFAAQSQNWRHSRPNPHQRFPLPSGRAHRVPPHNIGSHFALLVFAVCGLGRLLRKPPSAAKRPRTQVFALRASHLRRHSRPLLAFLQGKW